MEEKDDEISIDLGKIKNFFKRKNEEKKIEPKPQSEQENKEPVKTENEKFEPKQESASEKDGEEFNIDFSKIKNIKNIFKRSESKAEKAESDEDVSIDIKKLGNFIVERRVLLLLVIPIFLSIFLRVQPAFLPITDQWAADSVINNIRSQISDQISQQYPNLPSQNRNALVENELQKVLGEQRSQIDEQIQATSNFFKSRLQDDTGQTYLLAIDPHFWMRHARNILQNGHPGDEIREGILWDNHMLAPIGRPVPFDMFHAYFTAFLFKFFSIFNQDLNLMRIAFYVPVIISSLAVIPAFFITRKIAGNFAGFIAATIVAIHPSFLARTIGGFSDTDPYTVTFPLFIAWLFLEALEAKSIKNNVILSAAGGFLTGIYSFAWSGWWYVFDFILVSTALYIAYYAYVHKKELLKDFVSFTKKRAIKNSVAFFIVFFIISALSVSLFVNFNAFTESFSRGPIGFAKLKEVGITRIWPNVYTTVAEQNPASLDNVVNQVGLGKESLFLIALMGITLTITRREHKKWWFVISALVWYTTIFFLNVQNLSTFLVLIIIPILIRIIIALWESDMDIDIKYGIFMILWFGATTFASTKGIRFIQLSVPAFAIGFGVALGEAYEFASAWIAKNLHVNKIISKTIVIVVLLLLLVAPYRSAASTARQEIPSFNDAWKISLEKIKEDSKPDAIINSWWDFGHWFKFWADRAVTFDGTSQNTAQAHFIGRVLLTDNEKIAVGILRMLDCGATEGFNIIDSRTKDGAEAVDILYDIFPVQREDAKKFLTNKTNKSDEEIAEKVLEKTHCEPPEDYFITSEDMVGKSGVWGHFGSWDFDRALIYNTLKKKEYRDNLSKGTKFLQERFNYSNKHAENLFYEVQSIKTSDQANSWIAPWPGYAGSSGCSKIEENLFSCNVAGIPFIANTTSYEMYADSANGRVHPKLASFQTSEGIILKEYNESIITLQNGRHLGVALAKEGDGYRAVAMDSDLTASMFTRMFYQDGIGLEHFKKFSDEKSVFGNQIIVWKVDWEGNSTSKN